MTSTPTLDFDTCAAEPIRIPGAIQPHGALLVVDPDTLQPLHASANLHDVAGFALGDGPLSGIEAASELAVEVRRWLAGGASTLLRVVTVGRRPLQVLGHRGEQGAILEFEPPPASEAETLEGLYPRLRKFLDSLGRAPDLLEIASAAAAEVRALTGFNRVMLYQFDEKGDGHVLAEDTDDVLPSYLGHRFPASDIPAQARDLYRLNRLRLIPNSNYDPSPVEPAVSPVDGKPLDLSFAALRSVSPIHLEYMRNMGTDSSMSISIVVEDRLWGLISGHHREPKQVNAQLRTACDILGQVLSLHIEARQQAKRTRENLRLKEIETELLAHLAASRSFQAGMVESADLWMALTGAGGAAIITDELRAVGSVPPDDAIRTIAETLGADSADVTVTDSMSERWPEMAPFAAEASGLLAARISQIHPHYILWFRPEVVRTITWAGDPAKPAEPGQDWLHPRKSFDLWREQVERRSLPWHETEVESAVSFRNSINSFVLRRAEERAVLTDRLERANKELESFSYSVSHDLRAPFRHIVGFAELLRERETGLDQKSRHYLESIKDAALGAGRLVDDLLNFSQLGRSTLTFTVVDMTKLLGEARRTLELEVANRTIEWRIGQLPKAWGDSTMLRQVWQNLIENAVKYTRPRDPAVIEIDATDEGGRVRYCIRDNGVGFEMDYVSKLFGVFQRLHSPDAFAGTGIGLALVKRIVERHGGEVTAHGEPDHGAEFTFALPKRQNSFNGA